MLLDFRSFMSRYGANVAGFFYNAGGIFQLIAGVALSSPRDIIAAVLNFTSASLLNFWGHRNGAIIIASFLAIVLTFLTDYPALVAGEISSFLAMTFYVVIQIVCILNAYLRRLFGASTSMLLRETLGAPRRLVGVSSFIFCRLPFVLGNGLHHRWVPTIIFSIWACADLAFSMSKPIISQSALAKS